ncbi:MAG: radical SAM protein [Microcoleus sp. PH2017_40_RAT_O_B]|uniref:SPL family radical SAM protein n=1 Tax=unclassified Microcoleus TaxID=2642155 RepID=UPI001D5BEE2C|nr:MULTISPECIES: radical SAM protein [unclassified Microcoleus]TAE57230.1 MAG: radical SAM protein [Oscillatoriales cyanobacterium]MCC3438361.1 radical SAM protein [Microcoleus sp. PH2017_05_CCC_O_A]MCC3569386.1 radical SAM protein [Microcoleus sp. PH2017_31_RDM_U_A]MCC3573403.1 radical SAM protein [Microcoleus sp. PH2017_34_RAT_O_A]MCC3581708.1 radical SAM protein [Microcoleus sp. PH2017_32_RDM_D_A]
MVKSQYEGYSVGKKHTSALRENFGNAKVYAQNAQSVLNKATGFISAYDFTLNPYRGCQYGCSYCYAAAFSPNSQMRDDWGNWVIIKQNAVAILKKELECWHKKNPDRPPTIYMSSVTDPYQPIESKEQLTRHLLEVMVPYQPTLVIQTRSPMITRDIDILQQFQRLRINMSIPTGSEKVRKDFEPKSPSIPARLKAIAKLKYSFPYQENCEVRFSITVTPLLPTLPEDEGNFISKLEVVDRVVIQDFHASNERSLIASTRSEALALKQKYAWWYNSEQQSYRKFKNKLKAMLPDVEIMEGKEGFGYE